MNPEIENLTAFRNRIAQATDTLSELVEMLGSCGHFFAGICGCIRDRYDRTVIQKHW